MPERPCLTALMAILSLSTGGCSRLKGMASGGDSGVTPAGSASAPAAESSTWAANAADVARFQDEVPFGPDAIIDQDKTVVRRSPGSSDVVATLPTGADVVKLSTHGTDDLVAFEDPADSGARLIGWVPTASLKELAPAPTVPPTVDDGGLPPPPPAPDPGGGGRHKRHPHGGHHQQPPQQQ